MSASYLNDIERDRRNPPNAHIIRQLASTLDLDQDYLFFLAGRIPIDLLEVPYDKVTISRAIKTLRRTLLGNSEQGVPWPTRVKEHGMSYCRTGPDSDVYISLVGE